jgi:hypothetical protein
VFGQHFCLLSYPKGEGGVVKFTLVQALRLCTGRTAHSGSRSIALLFYDHSTRRGWGVSVTPRPLFTPGKDPVPIVQEVGWAPGPVCTDAENFVPAGIFFMNHLLVLPIEVQYSCVFTMVLRAETYLHASRVQCVGGIGRCESGFRIGSFGAGGSVRVLWIQWHLRSLCMLSRVLSLWKMITYNVSR